jgi:Lrp/AsnC family leucine-responsive transcriptional regulator
MKAYLREMTHLEELVGKIQFYGNTETFIIMSSPIEGKEI